MTIGERIKNRRIELGLSVDDVAAKINKNRATVYRYESDEIENLPTTVLEPLAQILQTTPAYLMGYIDAPRNNFLVDESGCEYNTKSFKEIKNNAVFIPQHVCSIPVLGSIPAGAAIEAVQDIIEWIDIPEEWTHGDRLYFGLQVKGDSMFPEYLEGDTVILRKQPCCDSGDDCAVMVNDSEATLKRIRIYEDGLELEAINPMHGKKKYSNREVKDLPVSILGVVVELRRKKK